jgi:hypothetical protein
MTANELVVVIGLLCSSVKDKEAKISCFEYYTNCAVKSGGKLLSKTEIIDKCLVYKEKFYNKE